jgi:hypothetical protein
LKLNLNNVYTVDNCVFTSPVNSDAVLNIDGVEYQNGASVTFPGYLPTNIRAWNQVDQPAPSSAIYTLSPGGSGYYYQDFRTNSVQQNGKCNLQWAGSLAASGSQLLIAGIGTQTVSGFGAIVRGVSVSSSGSPDIEFGYVTGSVYSNTQNTLHADLASSNFSTSSGTLSGKLAFYIDASGYVWVNNGTANTLYCTVDMSALL